MEIFDKISIKVTLFRERITSQGPWIVYYSQLRAYCYSYHINKGEALKKHNVPILYQKKHKQNLSW